jgi:uncharacterized protein YhbP (UPF0306 family)
MQEPDLRKLIKDYLEKAKLMQLATSVENQPWVCNVWFAADENLNIYWFSSTSRRHSEEVMKNPKVAAAIVFPQTPKDTPRGLQLQGSAQLLMEQSHIDKAISVYADRIFTREQILEFMNDVENPHKFYRIKPTQFVLFDIVNFPENSRRELNL